MTPKPSMIALGAMALIVLAGPALAQSIDLSPVQTLLQGIVEGALHLKPQTQRVDLETLRQIGLQRLGDGEDCGRGIARWNSNGKSNRREIGHREAPE